MLHEHRLPETSGIGIMGDHAGRPEIPELQAGERHSQDEFLDDFTQLIGMNFGFVQEPVLAVIVSADPGNSGGREGILPEVPLSFDPDDTGKEMFRIHEVKASSLLWAPKRLITWKTRWWPAPCRSTSGRTDPGALSWIASSR
ncbi:hypothetical protein ACIQD5_10720 [Streptomyces microflavus]|uniref:hypothetical protein n=1 Tax=Streptomyces microflavus TaxID=1919 RepID=UPI0038235C9F